MKKSMLYPEILPTLYWASLVHLLIAVAGAPMTQMGDLNMFKLWAIKAFDVGIHQAFVDPEFRYDWLPLYLYVSKTIGVVYDLSGLREAFGPWSRGLSVLLKCTMVGFHLVTAYFLYAVCRVVGQDEKQANLCALLFVWHPGILIATDLYGYQDAFHTALLAAALLVLLTDKRRLTFLAPVAAMRLPMRWIYSVLSITFAVGLMTTKWWLETDDFFQIGFLRVETLNAVVNVSVFAVWLALFFSKQLEVKELKVDIESEK